MICPLTVNVFPTAALGISIRNESSITIKFPCTPKSADKYGAKHWSFAVGMSEDNTFHPVVFFVMVLFKEIKTNLFVLYQTPPSINTALSTSKSLSGKYILY